MAAPATIDEFLELVHKSGVAEAKRLDMYLQKLRSSNSLPAEPSKLAGVLVRDGLLTQFQAENIMLGKWRRFTIGKYKVLERLGSGGMGSVYLCEHKLMRRRVAVKVLPTAKAQDSSALQRFYREARAVAALDHPNIVHAYDIDQDENLHFLVMEYVDGASLQDLVKKSGPLEVPRAAHYIRQAALGLEHAHQAGLVHRDIKPGNILVDRSGVVKIMDMGLARFFNDEDDNLTRKYDENVLGTADYLAPEQAVDSHDVDIRADIYSLGATFFFLLTGKPPFGEGTVAQKLIWHQTKKPKALHELRNGVPEQLSAVVAKMMAKEPSDRFQHPGEVAEALASWTEMQINPPSESEMPRLSLAAASVPSMSGDQTVVSRSKGAMAPATVEASGTPLPQRPGGYQTLAPSRSDSPPPPDDSSAGEVWEQLVDTAAPSSRADTTRGSGSSKRRRTADTPEITKSSTARLTLLIVVPLVGVILLGAVIFLVISNLTTPAPSPERETTIRVGKGGAYQTVQDALRHAKNGDVILLLDREHRENLLVSPKHGATKVTMRAAPNTKVIWKSAKKDEKTPLLSLNKAEGFRVHGDNIIFDGTFDDKKLKNLVEIQLQSAGTQIKGVQLVNFSRSGVTMLNCEGSPEQPVLLDNVLITTTDLEASAILFRANPQATIENNNHIRVEPSCQFVGISPKRAIKAQYLPNQKRTAVIGSDVQLPVVEQWEAIDKNGQIIRPPTKPKPAPKTKPAPKKA